MRYIELTKGNKTIYGWGHTDFIGLLYWVIGPFSKDAA